MIKGICGLCKKESKKTEFKKKTLHGLKIFICPKCGNYNSEVIFKKNILLNNENRNGK